MAIILNGTTGIDMGNTPVSNIVNGDNNDAVNKDYAIGRVTSTDNAVVRFNGTTGDVQNSGIIIDDNGNVGVGVTPNAWYGSYTRAIEIGTAPNNGTIWSSLNQAHSHIGIGANFYIDSSFTPKYKASYIASQYEQSNGAHYWQIAPSGTAGNTITWNTAMALDASGQLTMSPTSNGVKVNSNTTTGVSFWTDNTQVASVGWYHFYGTSSNNTHADIAIFGNGNVVNSNNSYGSVSDIKLKENVVNTSPKLDKLMQVRVVNYNLIGDDQKQIGVIAQEVEKIFPSVIDETKDTKQIEVEKEREKTLEDGTVEIEKYTETETVETGETTKNVKYSVIYMMMLKGMQELNDKVDAQKQEIDELRKMIIDMKGAI